jgi:hypothetical protein
MQCARLKSSMSPRCTQPSGTGSHPEQAQKHAPIAEHPPWFKLAHTHCMNCCDTALHDDGQPGPDAPQACMIWQNRLHEHSTPSSHGPQSAGQVEQLSEA